MKSALVIALGCFALVMMSTADSSDHMTEVEGNTLLLQETLKEGAQAKEGIQAHLKQGAKATMKIWGKEVSRAKVEMAKKQLNKVIRKMSVKRPEIMSSISTIQEVTDHPEVLGEGKLEGGYKKLRKVLYKVDQLEQELFDEAELLTQQYNAAKKKCDDEWSFSERKLNEMIEKYESLKRETREHRNGIVSDKEGIKRSEDKEVKVWNARMTENDEAKSAAYDKYWLESDDRAAVRNVLMQAVWLVCYGFRKFRHDDFCTTLRKEPDFADDLAQPEAKGQEHKDNAKTSYAFSETMEEVWKQQKAADAHAANAEDGDPDMEKGFVNNRAPWGVDPELASQSLIEEAAGVDSSDVQKDGTMSSQALAARLDFLLTSSNMPEKAAAPIADLIEALQEDQGEEEETATDDKKADKKAKLGEASNDDPWWKKQWSKYDKDDGKKKTLVQIMVDIEKEQGTLQHEADLEWFSRVGYQRNGAQQDVMGMNQETRIQTEYGQSIKDHAKAIGEISKVDIGVKKSIDDLTASMHDDMEICQVEWMDIDVQREANEEEQINIKRLNSLLRFLALGDTPICESSDEKKEPCNKERDRGSCEWFTRGMSAGGSGTSDEKEKTFCACEWGYYGEECEKVKCPGIGKILYKGTDPGVCSNRGGKCDDDYCEDNGCDTERGLCVECYHKYHGYGAKVNKCQFKFCPMAHSSDEGGADHQNGEGYILPKNEAQLDDQCSRHGQCDKRSGRCACDPAWWGDHCGWKKCPGAVSEGQNAVEARFAGWAASACHNRGECITKEVDGEKIGFCKCDENYNYGKSCEFHKCGSGGTGKECQGKGECQKETGMCMCDKGFHGARCEGSSDGSTEKCFSCHYMDCFEKCGNHGACNQIEGKCVCDNNKEDFYNGGVCRTPCRQDEYTADWTRSFDKWGWSTCKHNFLMTGIARDGAGDALYNLAYAKCARPCEGSASDRNSLRLQHCYHENWWKKFDFAGGKFCRKNYFMAGMFRSHCNSLYCIEMAKCCQVQRSLWNVCKWADVAGALSERNCKAPNADGIIECPFARVDDDKSFMAGLYRNKLHTLDGITHIRQCIPYFFGKACRPGESGDTCDRGVN